MPEQLCEAITKNLLLTVEHGITDVLKTQDVDFR